MSEPFAPGTEARLKIIIDLGERLFVLLLFATFLVRLSHSLGVRPYNILAIFSEGLVVFFIIVRRRPKTVTMRGWDWFAALAGTALPMMVRAGGHPLVPVAIGTVMMFAGLLLAILAKLTLRRSFGVAAANRGAVISGPYRLIRHPMYAGYLIVYVGFFLNNPSVWNAAIYALGIAMQVARIFAEEAVLKQDPAYAAYRAKVRYRLLPGLV